MQSKEFEGLLARAVQLIPEKDPTHGTPLRDGFQKTLREHWNSPPVTSYRKALHIIQQFYQENQLTEVDDRQHPFVSYQELMDAYGTLDEDKCRRILFFPGRLEMNFYKAILSRQFGEDTANEQDKFLKKLFLGIFYLMHIQQQDKHNGVWNVIEPFLVNDNVHKTDLKLHSVEAINKHTNSGIIVLANLFLEGNLQMRSQAIDAFYQITAMEPFDWFKAPQTVESTELHRAMFGLVDSPFLLFLANNRDSSYPGGSLCCLQLIAWWLSWLRLLHSDGHLRIAEAFLRFLKEWKQISEDSASMMTDPSEKARQQEEAKLAEQLVSDFGRFGCVEKGFPTLGGSGAALERLKYTKSRELISDENLGFLNMAVYKHQYSTETATEEARQKPPIEKGPHREEYLKEINRLREEGNNNFRDKKLHKAIRNYSDSLEKLGEVVEHSNIIMEQDSEIHTTFLKLLSNRANTFFRLSKAETESTSQNETEKKESEEKKSGETTKSRYVGNPVRCLLNCLHDCYCALASKLPRAYPQERKSLPEDVSNILSGSHILLAKIVGNNNRVLLWKVVFRLSQAAKHLGQFSLASEASEQCERILENQQLFDEHTHKYFLQQVQDLKRDAQQEKDIMDLATKSNSDTSGLALEAEILGLLLERTEYGGPGRDIDHHLEEEEAEWSNSRAKLEAARKRREEESKIRQNVKDTVGFARAGIVSSGDWANFPTSQSNRKAGHLERTQKDKSKERVVPFSPDFVSGRSNSNNSTGVGAALLEKLANQKRISDFLERVLSLSPKKLGKCIGSGLSEDIVTAMVPALRKGLEEDSLSYTRACKYLGTIAELPRFGFVVDFLNQDCKKDLCNLADDILSQVSDSDCSSTKQFQALQDAAAKLSL